MSASEASELRHTLHVAVLDALMASRRWAPGDLIFQGGTSLHLVHGSPRFSEDLDFLVRSTLDLGSIGSAIQARLERSAWIPRDARLSITTAKDDRNPHTFDVVVGGPSIIGSVRVRVEFWQTPEEAMKPLTVVVSPVRLASGPNAGAQAFVPAAVEREIYADKVFAIAARPYLKPRDVFDLDWLLRRNAGLSCTTADLQIRLATYPNENPRAWLEKAQARLVQLPEQHEAIGRDLARWLPSSWPLQADDVQSMIASASTALSRAIETMRALVDGRAASGPADDPTPARRSAPRA